MSGPAIHCPLTGRPRLPCPPPEGGGRGGGSSRAPLCCPFARRRSTAAAAPAGKGAPRVSGRRGRRGSLLSPPPRNFPKSSGQPARPWRRAPAGPPGGPCRGRLSGGFPLPRREGCAVRPPRASSTAREGVFSLRAASPRCPAGRGSGGLCWQAASGPSPGRAVGRAGCGGGRAEGLRGSGVSQTWLKESSISAAAPQDALGVDLGAA